MTSMQVELGLVSTAGEDPSTTPRPTGAASPTSKAARMFEPWTRVERMFEAIESSELRQ